MIIFYIILCKIIIRASIKIYSILVIIRTINVCNTSATDKTFSINVIPSGGTAGANNKVISSVTVPANDVIHSDSVYVLNAGDALYYDPVDSNLTLTINGVEYVA